MAATQLKKKSEIPEASSMADLAGKRMLLIDPNAAEGAATELGWIDFTALKGEHIIGPNMVLPIFKFSVSLKASEPGTYSNLKLANGSAAPAIVVTAEDMASLYTYLVYNSITNAWSKDVKKVDTIVESTNFFKTANYNLIQGSYIGPNGDIVVTAGWAYVRIFGLLANTVYSFKTDVTGTLRYEDNTGAIIGSTGFMTQGTITTPANIHALCINVKRDTSDLQTGLNNLVVVKGNDYNAPKYAIKEEYKSAFEVAIPTLPIVQNLSQPNTTDVPSTQLLSDNIYLEDTNIFVGYQITNVQYVNTTDGSLQSAAGFATAILKGLVAGENYTFLNLLTNTPIRFEDANGALISRTSTVNAPFAFIVPAGATQIRITATNNTTTNNNYSAVKLVKGSINLLGSKRLKPNISQSVIALDNRVNANNRLLGGINASYQYTTGGSHTLVPVTVGEDLFVYNSANDYSATGWAAFINGAELSTATIVGGISWNNLWASVNGVTVLRVKVPTGVTHIVINNPTALKWYVGNNFYSISNNPPAYKAAPSSLLGYEFLTRDYIPKSKYDKKNIVMMGDSTVEGTNFGYMSFIAAETNAWIDNWGSSGGNANRMLQILKGTYAGALPPNRLDKTQTKPDLVNASAVFFSIGFNDGTVGTFDDVMAATTPATYPNLSTWPDNMIGNMMACIEYCLSINNNLRIYVASQHYRSGSQVVQKQKRDELKKVAEYFSAVFVNVADECGINPYTNPQALYDGLHLSTYGNKLVGRVVADALVNR